MELWNLVEEKFLTEEPGDFVADPELQITITIINPTMTTTTKQTIQIQLHANHR